MALETAQLLSIYRKMATIRAFNHRAAAESLAGNIPAAIRPYLGEEASSVGAFSPFKKSSILSRILSGLR